MVVLHGGEGGVRLSGERPCLLAWALAQVTPTDLGAAQVPPNLPNPD